MNFEWKLPDRFYEMFPYCTGKDAAYIFQPFTAWGYCAAAWVEYKLPKAYARMVLEGK